MTKAIGILGGTFDPVHHGHLRSGVEVAQRFQLDHVRLIPCGQPPHRNSPVATAEQRLMMLHLAIKTSSYFVVDDRELQRQGPSYTVDTLTSLRHDFVDNPLFLLVGTDAFAAINSWHNWQLLLDLAHIVVMTRPGETIQLTEDLQQWYHQHKGKTGDEQLKSGKIWPVTVTQLAISATAIRADIANGISPDFLLPDAELQLITQLDLYRAKK